MFKKLLIATDLSPASDCLLQCATELKSAGLRQAILAHVIYVANTPGLEDTMAAEAAPLLAKQKTAFEQGGIETVSEMRLGIPAHTLNEIAEQHGVGAILIGTRGRGVLQRAILGSTAFKLLHVARKPVLLARIQLLGKGNNCRFSVCRKLFGRILFPTDFSATAEHAFRHLEQLAPELGGEVTLLHVQNPAHQPIDRSGRDAEEPGHGARQRLEELQQRLTQLGVQTGLELASGEPRREVLQRAASGQYSLIAMGTQGLGFFQEALLGSLAHEIACQADLPVLFFPCHT